MTATQSSAATALGGLLGTVGEAVTGEVVVLIAYRVHELMTVQPVTARPGWPLTQAVLAMEQVGINRLPVVDSAGRPAGILTRDDVLRVLARRIRGSDPPARHGSQVEPD